MILAAYAVPHPPIIVPEIGKGEEKKIARTSAAYDAVMAEAAALHADTLVITSPHADAYVDYFAISPGTEAEGSFGQFGAPQVRIKVSYDKALAAAISERAEDKGLAAGLLGTRHPELDHGTLLPLYFYQKHGDVNTLKIVRIGLSGLSPEAHYALGKTIAEAASSLKRRIIFIASGDLSHKLREDGPAMPLKVPFCTGTACLFLKRRILSPYSPWIPLFQGKPPNAGSTLFGSWQAPWMALPFPRRATPTRTFLVSATAL